MNTTLEPADFKETTIKTAFEQMRANAIINAEHNARGISIIDFNITTFLSKRRQKDALFILGLWAVQPIKQNTERFKDHPIQGQTALQKRAENLIDHLNRRPDISDEFARESLLHIQNIIEQTFNSIKVAQTA